ncbi:MAG: hypothetical protein JNK09_04230 [Prolixibacteraceae bacterium]|nr:hypothetical protein [Prolixibacteraceae bacterium]
MKRFFLVLLMVSTVSMVLAVQPARKPFIQLTVDGKQIKNGEVLTVNPGQKFVVQATLEGGRRDFCNFPDIYADIAGTSEILSRGKNGLIYQLNGVKAEWKLLNELIRFTGDDPIKVNQENEKSSAEIIFPKSTFPQSALKITADAEWQFIQEGQTLQEKNKAEAVLYFKLAGSSDVWFSEHHVQASGMKNDQVLEQLALVQAGYDTIENNFNKLKFSAVQSSIKNLQATIASLKSTIDQVKAATPTFQSKIVFIGLPSDNAFKNLSTLLAIKTSWTALEPLVQEIQTQATTLPEKETKEGKELLVKLIEKYIDWQYKLPENTFQILPLYIPDLKPEDIQLSGNLQFIAEEKSVSNYEQTLNDYKTFLNKRLEVAANETQKIGTTQTRLQAVRLFDGMLRSYFSSINWAEWKDMRQ